MKAQRIAQAINNYINDEPLLMSLLYDLGMLPEQLKIGSRDWCRMVLISRHHHMLMKLSERRQKVSLMITTENKKP